ncbi:MAG TPA: TIGR03085 family metal-binding protein [Streptosporangiaceae bacterium]|nr:TIGR03085 family metal-binding protein [Streptosporangiaceae bacterium]
MTYARDERLELCALLDRTGPDAPTLCAGWRTADLAAHLVLREHRPDAAAGVMGGPLARHTAQTQRKLSKRTPYPKLVEMIRTGPPRFSFFGIPGVDAKANFAEYFVHHEDVRRAQPDWEPRDLSTDLTDIVWSQLSHARLMLRKVPVGIEFARDDLGDRPGSQQPGTQPSAQRPVRMTVRPRTPVVTVIGAPAELLMWTFGRTGAARVRLEGAEADVSALEKAHWGV